MTTIKGCNVIRDGLLRSGLHYFVKESPHSIWISVRKKLIQEKSAICHPADMEPVENALNDLNTMKEQYDLLLEGYDKLKVAFEEENY